MVKAKYFMVIFGDDKMLVDKNLRGSQNPATFESVKIAFNDNTLHPDGTNIKQTKIPNCFFIEDPTGTKTEEEISNFYRRIILRDNMLIKYIPDVLEHVDIFVKMVSSKLGIL